MLNQEFISNGFCFIKPCHYISQENFYSIHDLKKIFDLELQDDGYSFRKRSYLKLHLTKNTKIEVAKNQNYFQSAASNKVDGGKIRQFKVMDHKILKIPIIKNIIDSNIKMIYQYLPLQSEDFLTIGLHFIRYQADENSVSYSSPDWLHKDDEPLVFVHLINLSKTALGGDNLIANSQTQKITHVIRLENEIDTLVLNKNVYHAVTPLGSKNGVSTRDVILFTVEPGYTQQ